MRDGVLALVATLGVNGHLEAIALIAAYIADDGALRAVETPPDEGAVGALGGLLEELTREMRLRLGALGHDEQPARILVDAVHEPQAWILGVVVRVILEVIGQGIDQCPRIVAMPGMDDEARGLIDHQEVFVLVDDVQRDILGDDLQLTARTAQLERDDLEGLNAVVGLDGAVADEDIAALQRLLDAAAGGVGHARGEELIDAQQLLPLVGDDAEVLVERRAVGVRQIGDGRGILPLVLLVLEELPVQLVG